MHPSEQALMNKVTHGEGYMPSPEISDLLKQQEPETFSRLVHKFHENIIAIVSIVIAYEELVTKILPPDRLPELRASVDTFIPLVSDLRSTVTEIFTGDREAISDKYYDGVRRRW